MKQLLIVGIDPGTTTAYATLSLTGQIVSVGSGKWLDADGVLREITTNGRPLAIGTDKAKTPGTVDSIATTVGARLFNPPEDLSVTEKRELLAGDKASNNHEKDAIACARYAHKRLAPLLRRISAAVSEDLKGREDEFVNLVVRKRLSITAARAALLESDEPASILRQELHKDAPPERHKAIAMLYDSLIDARRAQQSARDECGRLSAENAQLRKTLTKAQSRTTTTVLRDRKIQDAERQRQGAQLAFETERSRLRAAKESLDRTIRLLIEFPDAIIAKRLENLGTREFEQKRVSLRIRHGDTLWVVSPSSFSATTLEELRNGAHVLVCEGKPSREVRAAVTCVPAQKVRGERINNLVLIPRDKLESAVRSATVLEDVVVAYKEERSTDIR